MEKIKREIPEYEIRKAKEKLTLPDVACSGEFTRRVTSAGAVLLASHNRVRRVGFSIYYNPLDNTTAYTDNSRCTVNAGNEMFSKEAGSEEKEVSVKEACKRIYGACFHELGHVLYTSFSERYRLNNLFEKGQLDLPKDLPKEMEPSFEELTDLLNEGKSFVDKGFSVSSLKDFICWLYMSLSNIVEDGRIENLLLTNDTRFSGLCAGLQALRSYHIEELRQLPCGEHDIQTYMNLCLMYAKYHDLGSYDGSFDEFENAKPVIDEMLQCNEAKVFSEYTTILVLCAWPIIKDLITENAPEGQSGSGDSKDCNGGQGPKTEGSGKASGGEQGEPQNGEVSSEGGSGEKGQKKSLEDVLKEIKDEVNKALPKEESMQDDSGEAEAKENDSSVQDSPPKETDDGTTLEATLDKILKDLADDKVRNEAEAKACEQTGTPIRGKGFEEYKGTRVVSMNPALGVGDLLESINAASNSAVMKASREIRRHLEQDMRTGSSKRKFSGKKFHANKVVNRDFRYFEDKATKKDMPKVKVGLVIDESGSMSCGHRFKAARAAAITLWNIFENVPNLDIAIYGHSTCSEVEIYHYTDFGIKQKKMPERLANIQARAGNIDIVPVTCMAENLLRQDADVRIMFIITDGLPYSYVRGMTPEEELSIAADKYSRKGIDIIVASIGDDEKTLRNIYKNQRFLNISNSQDLPKKVVDVIKRKL